MLTATETFIFDLNPYVLVTERMKLMYYSTDPL